jgi:hypothetical protein
MLYAGEHPKKSISLQQSKLGYSLELGHKFNHYRATALNAIEKQVGRYISDSVVSRPAPATMTSFWPSVVLMVLMMSKRRRTRGSGTSGCKIKGNISKSGKIYHGPGSRWYDRTKIDEAKGEKWFCSTSEAEQAGWRAPR